MIICDPNCNRLFLVIAAAAAAVAVAPQWLMDERNVSHSPHTYHHYFQYCPFRSFFLSPSSNTLDTAQDEFEKELLVLFSFVSKKNVFRISIEEHDRLIGPIRLGGGGAI